MSVHGNKRTPSGQQQTTSLLQGTTMMKVSLLTEESWTIGFFLFPSSELEMKMLIFFCFVCVVLLSQKNQ
jgi:hypothetical protein